MATKAAPAPSKRRSTLAELGIKPGTETANSTTPPKTPTGATTAAAARRASVVRPSKTPATTTRSRPQSMMATTTATGTAASARASKTPGVQRSASMSRTGSQPTPAARKAAPAAINTARKPLSSSGNVASPTTPTPPAAKRRSMNASAASVAGTATPPSSPLVTRRGSKVQRTPSSGNSSSSTSSSTAATSALEEEVKSLKSQLVQQKQLLDDKDQIVQELQNKLTQLEKRPETPVLSSSSMLIPCDLSVDSASEKRKDEDVDVSEKKKEEEEEIRRQVKEELAKTHQEDMDRLLQEQERRLQSEIQIQQSEHEKKYESLVQEHQKQREALVQDYEKKITDLLHEHEQTTAAATQMQQDLEQKVENLEKTLSDSRQVTHLRKIEQQLADKSAAFEEFKQQAQQTTDQLERRFRDEMQQLQSGSEDGAKVWLDKHRAAQQEIDRLHGLLRELENKMIQERQELEALHEQQLEEWKEKCETHEVELDNQAHQTSALLQQVEDLQNSLEAATARLETAQKESSSSKTNTLPSSPVPAAVAAVVDHKACEQALDDLQRRMTSLKDAHETQLNRLGLEKARELQALREEMQALQTVLQQTKAVMEERIRSMAEQHSKEIKVLHQQYQKQADMKDKDLEQYAYRVKALTTAKQKEMDTLRKETMEKMEHTVEGYEVSQSPLLAYSLLFAQASFLPWAPISFCLVLQVLHPHDLIFYTLHFFFIFLPLPYFVFLNRPAFANSKSSSRIPRKRSMPTGMKTRSLKDLFTNFKPRSILAASRDDPHAFYRPYHTTAILLCRFILSQSLKYMPHLCFVIQDGTFPISSRGISGSATLPSFLTPHILGISNNLVRKEVHLSTDQSIVFPSGYTCVNVLPKWHF